MCCNVQYPKIIHKSCRNSDCLLNETKMLSFSRQEVAMMTEYAANTHAATHNQYTLSK